MVSADLTEKLTFSANGVSYQIIGRNRQGSNFNQTNKINLKQSAWSYKNTGNFKRNRSQFIKTELMRGDHHFNEKDTPATPKRD
jgi:hypothetical protein